MIDISPRLRAVFAQIDEANASDPRDEVIDGVSRPREMIYAERMCDCLARMYPAASEELQIAARAQHVCRWEISREDYPLGREGYNAWRFACRDHHGALVAQFMATDFSEDEIAQTVKIIKKKELKRDRESQALENVAGLVFVQYYLQPFVDNHKDYDVEKFVDILRKTIRKMDEVGVAGVRAIHLPDQLRQVVDLAMQ